MKVMLSLGSIPTNLKEDTSVLVREDYGAINASTLPSVAINLKVCSIATVPRGALNLQSVNLY